MYVGVILCLEVLPEGQYIYFFAYSLEGLVSASWSVVASRPLAFLLLCFQRFGFTLLTDTGRGALSRVSLCFRGVAARKSRIRNEAS